MEIKFKKEGISDYVNIQGGLNNGVHHFLGVPYARPPVGELRWRPPISLSLSDLDGNTFDATHFGSSAIQTVPPRTADALGDGVIENEDCLYLNIWTTQTNVKKPVMLWIHGGGFINWASSMKEWDGKVLAKENDVVVVSFNYRLGALGFLHTNPCNKQHNDEGAQCNFAVLDWVAALKWVSQHIQYFGGDPDNVTIFGQSVGAVAVRALLWTPLAECLFHKAIMLSGGGEDYAHVPSSSYQRLIKQGLLTFSKLPPSPTAGSLHTPANLIWYPVVDDQIVFSDFTSWAKKNVSILFGYTENEARFFIKTWGTFGYSDPNAIYTRDTLSAMTKILVGTDNDTSIQEFFHLNNEQQDTFHPYYEALDYPISTAIFKEPAYALYQKLVSIPPSSAYMYCF